MKYKLGEKVTSKGHGKNYGVGEIIITAGHGKSYLVKYGRYEFFETEDDLSRLERTIEDVQEGDLVEKDKGKIIRKVLGRCGQIVFLSWPWEKGEPEENSFSFISAIEDIKGQGYSIVNEPTPEIKEMTVADVEKLVGTKVKIVK